MIKRYYDLKSILHEHVEEWDIDVQNNIPSTAEDIILKRLIDTLEDFQSISKALQSEETPPTMAMV